MFWGQTCTVWTSCVSGKIVVKIFCNNKMNVIATLECKCHKVNKFLLAYIHNLI